MKTKVVVVGAGPAGMLLSNLLHLNDISHVVLEQKSRDYVLGRIRAGVLEWGSVEVLREAGLSHRMDADGIVHDKIEIAWEGNNTVSIETNKLLGLQMMAYGQTNLQQDLYDAADQAGTKVIFGAQDVNLHDVASDSPSVTFHHNGTKGKIDCDFIAGCDGFHGVSRPTIPRGIRREYEKVYPFGWLGILSETPPLPHLVYANHWRGFALCSMRNPMLSRYYVQCPATDTIEAWPDDRFWTELTARIPESIASNIVTGPSIEKSIAPLRSFVSEPMRYGRLYLAGDAAHIVPPTGAKGLNLAISDVHYLSRALVHHYQHGSDDYLDSYSDMALRRVWGAMRFSWSMTMMLHRFPDMTDFDQKAQEQQLHYLSSSIAAQTSFGEQYVGLPLEA